MRIRMLLAAMLCALLAVSVQAQTTPTGVLTGQVVDSSGAVMPGVRVTAASQTLQGTRSALTSANGEQHVVVALVEQGGHGSTTAAPIVRNIIEGIYGLQQSETVGAAGTD